jgi:hypothetical protein
MINIALLIGAASFAVATWALTSEISTDGQGECTTAPAVTPSPLDEAERILSRRYARGQITFEEYRRMNAVLRR